MSRPTVFALAAVCLTGALIPTARAEAPLLAIPGKVIYENSLAEKPGAPWTAAKGDWTATGGVLRGAELPADNHGAVLRMMGALPDNVIIEYQFRLLEGAKSTTLSINGVKDHLCRLIFTPATFTVQKDDKDHAGPDKAVVFNRQTADLKPGDWHTARMEIIGTTLLGKCDDLIGFGAHELIGEKKMNPGFTVSGQSVEFKNLRITEATPNPEWETVKATLPTGTPAPAPDRKGKGKGKANPGAKGKAAAKGDAEGKKKKSAEAN